MGKNIYLCVLSILLDCGILDIDAVFQSLEVFDGGSSKQICIWGVPVSHPIVKMWHLSIVLFFWAQHC